MRGGSERVLFEEMSKLKEGGHQVAIFTRSHPSNEPSEYDKHFPPEIETDRVTISLGALNTIRELMYSNSASHGLGQVIDKFQPNIAHAHNIYGRLSTSVLDTLKQNRVATVLTLHDYKLLCPSYLMLNHGQICEKCRNKKFYNAVITKCHKDSYLVSTVSAFESWFSHHFQKYNSIKFLISPSRFLREKVIEFGWNAGR